MLRSQSATDVFLFSNLPSVQFAVSKLLEVQSDKGLLDPCRGYVQPCSVNSSMSSRCQLLCSEVFEDLEDLGFKKTLEKPNRTATTQLNNSLLV